MKKIIHLIAVVFASIYFTSCGPSVKTNFWDNGNTRSTLEYKKDMLNGTSTWFYENGNKEQEATYVNNILHGPMTRWHSNGQVETRTHYVDGNLEGKAVTYNKKGKLISEENYVHDTLNGDFAVYYAEGTYKIKGQYNMGLYTGQWIYYDVTEKIIGVGNYENGTGMQKAWWPNGKLKREIPYVNNLKEGTERWFDENGVLENTIYYHQGIRMVNPE
ncbi:MAG: toxin-antitoxin system YwqK family antitoxin [Bacteroidales bacterium]|jgi:antitoxin component YwqK of YwqJK toxin-antitoxin module|nr:toxin-antitoxin system YwqK family antitoxin [Bacteroidales bacterium]